MTGARERNMHSSAHATLFADAVVANLRHIDDENRIVYELANTGGFTLWGKPRVRLTDMSTQFTTKTSAQLTLVETRRDYSRYVGSTKDVMGRVIDFSVRLRTDLDVDTAENGIIAAAEVTRSMRDAGLSAMLWQPRSVEYSEYDIYCARWEAARH